MGVDDRLKRAKRSLEGLSVGDAFGQKFFGDSGVVWSRVVGRVVPPASWEWTDDTAMARAIVQVLESHRQLAPAHLADIFAREYRRDPFRGYGAGAAEVLNQIADGTPWQTASSLLFRGSGSYGNGAAMRAAPIGAFFADDVEAVIEQATIASQLTHFHPDGVAGGVAVALAAAWWAQPRAGSMFEFVLEHTPPGAVRRAILKASEFATDTKPSVVAGELGNGSRITALDTVPFCLWSAARTDDYVDAMWYTVGVLGDRDTNCAIVGGILASSPEVSVPPSWVEAREPLA
ncbi:MAG: ADP-ribosylglycohydrolase family protein [Candidatus Eremiobacteraeota bacterium]|nr:ADP-ribosylglycohydrolase family protein [Candidatus Eremiobacteraeota bacterium]